MNVSDNDDDDDDAIDMFAGRRLHGFRKFGGFGTWGNRNHLLKKAWNVTLTRKDYLAALMELG